MVICTYTQYVFFERFFHLTRILRSPATPAPPGRPCLSAAALRDLFALSGAEPGGGESKTVPCALQRPLWRGRLGEQAAPEGVWNGEAVSRPVSRSMSRSPSLAARYLCSTRSHLIFQVVLVCACTQKKATRCQHCCVPADLTLEGQTVLKLKATRSLWHEVS